MKDGRQPDMVVPVEGINVASWSPGRDGEGIPCAQVHLILKIPELDVTFVTRLKSRRATDELIAALIEHRDFVWPVDLESRGIDGQGE